MGSTNRKGRLQMPTSEGHASFREPGKPLPRPPSRSRRERGTPQTPTEDVGRLTALEEKVEALTDSMQSLPREVAALRELVKHADTVFADLKEAREQLDGTIVTLAEEVDHHRKALATSRREFTERASDTLESTAHQLAEHATATLDAAAEGFAERTGSSARAAAEAGRVLEAARASLHEVEGRVEMHRHELENTLANERARLIRDVLQEAMAALKPKDRRHVAEMLAAKETTSPLVPPETTPSPPPTPTEWPQATDEPEPPTPEPLAPEPALDDEPLVDPWAEGSDEGPAGGRWGQEPGGDLDPVPATPVPRAGHDAGSQAAARDALYEFLIEIKGVGPARAAALTTEFADHHDLSKATPDEVEEFGGVPPSIAKRILTTVRRVV